MSGQANFDITRNIFTGNVSNGGMLGLYAYDGYGIIDHNIFNSNTSTNGDLYVNEADHVEIDHNYDVIPSDGSAALRVVNSSSISIDSEQIVGKFNGPSGANATASITLSGLFTPGAKIVANLKAPFPFYPSVPTGSQPSYTTVSGSSLSAAAAGLAAAINSSFAASGGGSFLSATAAPGSNVVILTIDDAGIVGNNAQVTTSVVPAIDITASPSAFGGGVGPPSYGLLIYDQANFPAVATVEVTETGTPTSGHVSVNIDNSVSGIDVKFGSTVPFGPADTPQTIASALAVGLFASCPSPCILAATPGAVNGIITLTSTQKTIASNALISVSGSGGGNFRIAPSPAATFYGGGSFDGINPNIIQNTRDVSIFDSTFDSVYRGVLIPGRFTAAYQQQQSNIVLANNVMVRSGDALLYVPLQYVSPAPSAPPVAQISHIRLIGNVVKDGTFFNGILFIDYAAGAGNVTDALVQGGACGSTSASPVPTPAASPACIRVTAGTVKLMGIDFSAWGLLEPPVIVSSPGCAYGVGNLGYPPAPTPSPCST